MENLHVTDRTVMNYIKELMKSGLITKAKKGFYEKVKFETGQATETYTNLFSVFICFSFSVDKCVTENMKELKAEIHQ